MVPFSQQTLRLIPLHFKDLIVGGWTFSLISIGQYGGLVVSASDFQPDGRWFEPELCRCVVSLDKKLFSTLSKWGEGGG